MASGSSSSPRADVPAPRASDAPADAPASSAPSSPSRDASLDLSVLLSTVLREKWLILAICLLTTGLAAGYTYTLTPIYQASSMVRVGAQGGNSAELMNSIMVETSGSSRSLESEIGVLQNSVDLAERVVRKLHAAVQAGGKASFPVLRGYNPADSTSVRPAARRVLEKASFSPRRGRNMIEIVVESKDPEEAATIANIYARQYKKLSQEKARASVTAAREFLEDQAEEQRAKIRRLEQRWEQFARSNQLVEEGEGGSRVAAKYNELEARRDELAFELERNRKQRELLRQQLRQFQPKLEQNVVTQQEASSLRSEIGALEEKIAQMKAEAADYYAANPDLEGDTARIQRDFPALARLNDRIQALEERKARLTQQLVDKASRVRGGSGEDGGPLNRIAQLRRQITEKKLAADQLQAQIAALDSQVVQYERRLDAIPEQRTQRRQLERKLEQAQTFQETIKSGLQKISVAEESELGYVKVVQSAFVPGVPVRPNTKQNVVLGLLLGLSLGVGLAFLKNALDTRLRRPKDIEEKGYTLLGVVPTMDPEIDQRFDGKDFIEVEGSTISTRLMPLLNPWSPVTENYRLIRTNLRRAEENRENPTFLVTSAQPKEGKTVTAANLALTEALAGQRVLLIDADLRKPTAHEMFGLPRNPGLVDVLDEMPEASSQREEPPPGPYIRGDDPSDEFSMRWLRRSSTNWMQCWQTPVEGLHLIPAGIAKSAPTAALDSERMRTLLEVTQEHFDVVVLDTPPTRATSDAVVIGAETEAVTLVVSADESDSRALDAAMKALHQAGSRVAGVILNRFDDQKAGDYAFNYAYYGADDYDEYQLEAPAPQQARTEA